MLKDIVSISKETITKLTPFTLRFTVAHFVTIDYNYIYGKHRDWEQSFKDENL